MHRLQVARLPQLLLAQLRGVELAQQLPEQVHMPLQRGAGAVAREDRQLEVLAFVHHRVVGPGPGLAVLPVRLPGGAGDPGQARQARHALGKEAFRPRLLLRELGKEIQPFLDRQPDREQVPGEEHVQARVAGARTPGESEDEDRAGDQEHGVGQRLKVADPRQGHEGEASQDHHAENQHQENAVEEIDHLGRLGRFGFRGHQGEREQQQRQAVFGRHADLRSDLPARRDLRQDHDREQGEQVDQHHEVAAALPARVVQEHLATH